MQFDRDLVPGRKKGLSGQNVLLATGVAFGLAILVRLLFHAYVAFPLFLPVPDMEPTLKQGDYYHVDRMIRAEDVQRGDLLLFRHPTVQDAYLFARLIALPGEQFQMHARVAYVNNQPLAELVDWEGPLEAAALAAPIPMIELGSTRRDYHEPLIIPEGLVFVLADNRATGLDSRDLGPISLALLEGRIKP